MATSGTVTFQTNRNDLIKAALQQIQGYDIENSSGPTAAQISAASQMLNMLLKFYETKGLQLWKRKYGVIFPQTNQGVFSLGTPGPGGDHACETTPLGIGGFVQTTLASSAASGATTISVSSVDSAFTVGVPVVSITSGYNIGIELEDGTLQWTTVSGAPSGTTVTLATALTDDAAEGANVFCYQTKLVKPLRILDAFVRQLPGLNDTPVNLIPREQYNRFGLKTATGVPTQLYYDPQRLKTFVYAYPQFSSVDQLLYIEFQVPIEDMTNATDDFDLPQEWELAIMFNLAMILAPSYQVPKETYTMIKEQAINALNQVDDWDQETGSVFLQPNQAILSTSYK